MSDYPQEFIDKVRAYYLSEERPSMLDTSLEFNITTNRLREFLGDDVRKPGGAKKPQRFPTESEKSKSKSRRDGYLNPTASIARASYRRQYR